MNTLSEPSSPSSSSTWRDVAQTDPMPTPINPGRKMNGVDINMPPSFTSMDRVTPIKMKGELTDREMMDIFNGFSKEDQSEMIFRCKHQNSEEKESCLLDVLSKIIQRVRNKPDNWIDEWIESGTIQGHFPKRASSPILIPLPLKNSGSGGRRSMRRHRRRATVGRTAAKRTGKKRVKSRRRTTSTQARKKRVRGRRSRSVRSSQR